MRIYWIYPLLGAALLCGCAATAHPDNGNTGKSTATASLGTGSSSVAAANAQDMPVPPKDAQYTIYCEEFDGPDHLLRSQAVRQALHDQTSMKDWYVVHKDDQSTLYYGFYRTFDRHNSGHKDQAEKALHDLGEIREMVDSNGYRPFASSLPVPIDSPDPTENPAWDLSRASGYWSLQVAAYKDSPQRKEAAVDVVRHMRANGIEAYYYHGPTVSSVCIGCWPKQAVRDITAADQNTDPDQNLIVTQQALPQKTQQMLSQKMGMKNVAPIIQPVDPTLIAAMQRYPESAVNGQVLGYPVNDPATGQRRIVPTRSFIVEIKHREVDDSSMNQVAAPPPPTSLQPDAVPGLGSLRSLGN